MLETDRKLIKEMKDHKVTHEFLCTLTHLEIYNHLELLSYAADMMMEESISRRIIARVAT